MLPDKRFRPHSDSILAIDRFRDFSLGTKVLPELGAENLDSAAILARSMNKGRSLLVRLADFRSLKYGQLLAQWGAQCQRRRTRLKPGVASIEPAPVKRHLLIRGHAMSKIIRNGHYADAIHARSTAVLAAAAIVLAVVTAVIAVGAHISPVAVSAGDARSAATRQNQNPTNPLHHQNHPSSGFFE